MASHVTINIRFYFWHYGGGTLVLKVLKKDMGRRGPFIYAYFFINITKGVTCMRARKGRMDFLEGNYYKLNGNY